MIDLYAWSTPNSIKVPILLEELGVAYTVKPINVRQGMQKTPEFLKLNPNGKVSIIVDHEGPAGEPITVVESGAILIYLAEKYGRFIPTDGVGRVRCLEWLFFQVAGLGPMFGQSGYFLKSAPEQVPFAIDRYNGEANRHLKIVDERLAEVPWLAGNEYSIADIAHFGWIWRREFAGVDFAHTPNVERWFRDVESRPAVQRAISALAI